MHDWKVAATFTVNGLTVPTHAEAVQHVRDWLDGYFEDIDREDSGELGDIIAIDVLGDNP